jgi:hypothetical protein
MRIVAFWAIVYLRLFLENDVGKCPQFLTYFFTEEVMSYI